MIAIMGLLSLALLGGEPQKPAPAGSIEVRVFHLETKGLSWRSPIHERLGDPDRRGGATVWTVDADLIPGIVDQARDVVEAPVVATRPGVPVRVVRQQVRRLVRDVHRVTDGPPGVRAAIAFQPDIDGEKDHFQADVTCREAAEGAVVANVELIDRHLCSVETVNVPDEVTNPKNGEKTTTIAQFQVPVTILGVAKGEWTVPKGKCLLVSLGAFTASDDSGKAVVRERLVVIDPHGASAARPMPVAVPGFRPMPINAPMLLSLASPTVAPRVGRKLSLSLSARPAPAVARDDAVQRTALTLPLTGPMPIRGWITLAIEPWLDQPRKVAMKSAEPPSRQLPVAITVDGQIAIEPAQIDEAIEPASADPSDEVRPAPQAQPIAKPMTIASQSYRGDDLGLEANEQVLYPAPAPAVAVAPAVCPEDGHETLTLTIDEAARLALQNGPTLRLVGSTHSGPARVIVAGRDASVPEAIVRSDATSRVLAVTRAYWELHRARTMLQARESAQAQANQAVAGFAARAQIGGGERAAREVRELNEYVGGRIRLTNFATIRARRAETALRSAMGLPDADSREIVLALPPMERIGIEFDTTAGPGMVKASAMRKMTSMQHHKATLATEGAAHDGATHAREEAAKAVETCANSREMGIGAIVKLLKALDAHEATVAHEVDCLVSYKLAVEKFEQEIGVGRGMVVAMPAGLAPSMGGRVLKSDSQAVQAAFQGPGAVVNAAQEAFRAEGVPFKTPTTTGHSTLGLTLTSATGACEFDSTIQLKATADRPVTMRVPMADGSVVEIQARVVESAKR